jgi:hypothetical protein
MATAVALISNGAESTAPDGKYQMTSGTAFRRPISAASAVLDAAVPVAAGPEPSAIAAAAEPQAVALTRYLDPAAAAMASEKPAEKQLVASKDRRPKS